MELTGYLAIYAALLSTAVFVWNVSKSRPKIHVKLIFAVEFVDGENIHGLSIAVQNPSAHVVHISNVSLLYPWRKPTFYDYLEHVFRFRRWPRNIGWIHTSLSNYDVDDRCPVALEPGTSHSVLVADEKLAKLLKDARSRKVKAVVQDALWRNKYSAVFNYPEMPSENALENAQDETPTNE